ncbi:hypothetical protein TRFO_33909 [Tritrichomonas foetus]|uniref:aspartyl aminopeptidase n=1 Tax=Tritrichomonas foetus TaxID=1144522 RepID=A0A1J4JLM5_9EUKA|nr:hypothetical protein TRFO_33909 [Tritrichomonas foetus]|eukprot:OHS99585.1 hypothetical protein TRFO_33909 [Tritrichomonas foetus]
MVIFQLFIFFSFIIIVYLSGPIWFFINQMEDFLNFIDISRSPFHFIDYSRKILSSNGFVEISEKESFPNPLPPKAFVIRDNRSIIAFIIGSKDSIIGVCANSDFPCFKLKPNHSQNIGKYQIARLKISGNGLWHTFLDREMKAVGRILVKEENSQKISFSEYLFETPHSIAIIPNVGLTQIENHNIEIKSSQENYNAILSCSKNDENLNKFIDENNINIIKTSYLSKNKSESLNFDSHIKNDDQICEEMNECIVMERGIKIDCLDMNENDQTTSLNQEKCEKTNNNDDIKSYLSKLVHVNENDIVGCDLSFVDASHTACYGGLMSGHGLNSLVGCYAGLHALLDSAEIADQKYESRSDSKNDQNSTQIFAAFDETGGRTSSRGEFLATILNEIIGSNNELLSARQRSLIIACKNFQSVLSFHETENPLSKSDLSRNDQLNNNLSNDIYNGLSNELSDTGMIGEGLLIGASHGEGITGASIVKDISEKILEIKITEIPKNIFNQNEKNEHKSTYSDNIFAQTGIKTVEVGCPMLSIGSTRETATWTDISSLKELFCNLYMYY